MKLWLLLLVGVLVVMLLLRPRALTRGSRRRWKQLREGEGGVRPDSAPGEVQVICPHCGGWRWLALGRVNPKSVVLCCTGCGRSITFVGDMVRLDQHLTPPSES